ncbi:MAG: 3-methyl-2-oxobutanoate hydroxymethyltransferase [Chloroflexi bacterium]|nr:3-methyl-2-oxobutanoate hydroxymethyltransferase [Chloroflexota bacterium]
MRVSISQIKEMKQRGQRIAMLTAYDYTTARALDEAGVPMLLVGDSLGMVVLGYESTVSVTMEEMVHHTKAVTRGAKQALVIADLPFLAYHLSTEQALRNAGRFIQEAGAQAVKLEGGVKMAETVRRIVDCGIPVMGHIGLTPQSINQLGGFKVQGKTASTAVDLIRDAEALQDAGAFAVVLECVPAPLARLATERLSIPTIGIGAGVHCDGQVQVVSDLLGLFSDFVPKHAKQYVRLADLIKEAATSYSADVTAGSFPTAKESFAMDERVVEEVRRQLQDKN